MEQFRQIGEVLGSLKALLVFKDNILINQRQCSFLLEIFTSAYNVIAEEMRESLKFEEKNAKWKLLEQPLRDLHRVFKDGEGYVRQCLENKDWFARAILLHQNTDCVELHVHNLLSAMPIVIEAIETVGEISGSDHDEVQNRRLLYSKKYQKEWKDQKLFQWKFAKQYLITRDFCNQIDTVWSEDRWVLVNKIREKKMSAGSKKQQLVDLVLQNLDGTTTCLNGKLLPSNVLVGSNDYQVRRRLGGGSQFKEIQWLGESFAMRHFFGEIERMLPEISLLISISHPNISHVLCGFTDDERKECFLVMELMSKDLNSYIKEVCGPKKKVPFSLPVAIDLMLQIARGMEYLHSKKIFHGNLNPSNILVRPRNNSNNSQTSDAYLHAKITGFGLSSIKSFSPKISSNINPNGALPFIWHAPEVLEEQETGNTIKCNYNEKADVYSFGMVCFELLTGKVPFEDSHLQGDKMSRNIRAGERPLFPFNSPKYVTNLTKRCWNSDPNQRPSFRSICRILRYIKRFLALNPDYNREIEPPMPSIDYSDLESKLIRKFPSWDSIDSSNSLVQIPFQMFVYRVAEKEKLLSPTAQKDTSESGSDKASSISGDDNLFSGIELEQFATYSSEKKLLTSSSDVALNRRAVSKKLDDVKTSRFPGTPNGRSPRPPSLGLCGRRSLRLGSESQLMLMTSPRARRSSSRHASASDSELP